MFDKKYMTFPDFPGFLDHFSKNLKMFFYYKICVKQDIFCTSIVFVVSLAKYQLVLIILNHVQSFFLVLFNRKRFFANLHFYVGSCHGSTRK